MKDNQLPRCHFEVYESVCRYLWVKVPSPKIYLLWGKSTLEWEAIKSWAVSFPTEVKHGIFMISPDAFSEKKYFDH